jgi:hypothetical protein
VKALRFCEMFGTTHRTNYTATHLRNVGKHRTNDTSHLRNVRHHSPSKRHGNTPKLREQLTEQAAWQHISETSENTGRTTRQHTPETPGTAHRTNDIQQLIRNVGKHRTTRGNTSPNSRERLAERAAHGNISESSENTERHEATPLKRRKRLIERATHDNTSHNTYILTC